MGNILWLASYPKSGNTWLRTLISNLLREESEEISINQLKTDGIFGSRKIFDRVTGIKASNLTFEEIDRLRPFVYNYLAKTAEKKLFIKVHDAYTYLEDGVPLLGTADTRAVYIIRNPLDVAVSFANHLSTDVGRAIELMGNPSFALSQDARGLHNQLRQKLGTWSGHVESWTRQRDIPVHVIRYEDMKMDPVDTFTGAVRFLGIDCTDGQILDAIEMSDFAKLKADEEKHGFKEKPYKVASFFRKGEVGDWRNHLSDEQRDQLIADHEKVMRSFGYLYEKGNPVF